MPELTIKQPRLHNNNYYYRTKPKPENHPVADINKYQCKAFKSMYLGRPKRQFGLLTFGASAQFAAEMGKQHPTESSIRKHILDSDCSTVMITFN